MKILCIGLDFLMLRAYQWKAVELAKLSTEFLAVVPARWRVLWSSELIEPEPGPLDDLPHHKVDLLVRINKHFALFPPRFLRRVLNAFQPDVCDLDNEPFNLSSAQVISATRRFSPHTRVFLHASQNLVKRYPPPFNATEQYAFRHCTGVFARNPEAADVLKRRGCQPAKIRVMGHGVSLKEFDQGRTRQLNGEAEPGSVLYVGYLAHQKGVDTLIEACANSVRFRKLTIVGEGPSTPDLHAQVDRLQMGDRVAFLGRLPQQALKELYGNHSCLVVPSRTTPTLVEQFGRVIIEAMASGCPVIASDSGNMPRVVGNAGLIFPEDDMSALAQALDRLLGHEHERHEIQRRCIERVEGVFEWSVRARAMLEVFENASSGSSHV